jgi:MFS transporter, putative metabolite:H+ symporter
MSHVVDSELAKRLDRLPLTRLHLLILAVCGLAFSFDLLEIALGSALSAVFSLPPHKVAPAQLSWLLAAPYVGAIVGAPLFGGLADSFGPKRVLTALLVGLAPMSFAIAASATIKGVIIFRALSGLALGACPPLIIGFLTDVLPPGRRGMLILILVAFAFLGQPAGVFLIRWLTPLQPLGVEAWRWAFLVGGAGTLAGGAAFLALPESPRWLVAKGRIEAANATLAAFERSVVVQSSVDVSFAPREDGTDDLVALSPNNMRRCFIVTGALLFLSSWATVAFPVLSGAVLVKKGHQLSDALLYVGIGAFGQFTGSLLGAIVIDRIERRTAIVLCAIAMAIVAVAFSLSTSGAGLIAAGFSFNLLAALYVPTLSLYAAELFPTHLRSSATSRTWAINRLGSALAPLVLIPLLHSKGIDAVFTVIVSALLCTTILTMAAGPRGMARRPVL